MTVKLSLAIFGAVQGMFLFGYNTGALNQVEGLVKEFLKQTRDDLTDSDARVHLTGAVNVWIAGGMIGALRYLITFNQFLFVDSLISGRDGHLKISDKKSRFICHARLVFWKFAQKLKPLIANVFLKITFRYFFMLFLYSFSFYSTF